MVDYMRARDDAAEASYVHPDRCMVSGLAAGLLWIAVGSISLCMPPPSTLLNFTRPFTKPRLGLSGQLRLLIKSCTIYWLVASIHNLSLGQK
jgi:hypothetical protein